MSDLNTRLAEMVNDWFQGEPTPERQQNPRRVDLIRDLQHLMDEADRERVDAAVRELEEMLAELRGQFGRDGTVLGRMGGVEDALRVVREVAAR
jgi:hypothetical protein